MSCLGISVMPSARNSVTKFSSPTSWRITDVTSRSRSFVNSAFAIRAFCSRTRGLYTCTKHVAGDFAPGFFRFAILLPLLDPFRNKASGSGQFRSPQLPRLVRLGESLRNLAVFSVCDLNRDANGQSAGLNGFDECDFFVFDQMDDTGNVHTFHSDLSGNIRHTISTFAEISNFAENVPI